MPRSALLIVLGLAACAVFDSGQPGDFGSGEMQGWRLASGKTPSRAEYAAIVAACQGGAVPRATAKPFEACLAELGLKPVP